MWCGQRRRRRSGGRVVYWFRRAGITGFKAAAIGFSFVAALPAHAGQLPASAFQVYNPANASSIQAGPFALYTVPVDQLQPTQMNEGFTEVNAKTNGFNLLLPSNFNANLLGDIQPVVIGPGGVLYLTDGHHTFTALENSSYGSTDPVVYVNVIANYSNLTTAQFFAQMQASDLLLPLNNGVPQAVNTATGSPIPTTLKGLTQDPYRGLEYSILKNKVRSCSRPPPTLQARWAPRSRVSTRIRDCIPISLGPTPTATPMAGADFPISRRATSVRHAVES